MMRHSHRLMDEPPPHRESKIASSEKMRIGGTSEMAWMQICDPSDKEKGHYTIEICDGVKTHARTFDLSGQGRSSSQPGRLSGSCNYCVINSLLTLRWFYSLHRRLRGIPEAEVSYQTAPNDHRSAPFTSAALTPPPFLFSQGGCIR